MSEMLLRSTPYQVGCRLQLAGKLPGDAPEAQYLFSENGGIVAEVASRAWPEVERMLKEYGAPWTVLGTTVPGDRLEIELTKESVSIDSARLAEAFEGQCRDLFG